MVGYANFSLSTYRTVAMVSMLIGSRIKNSRAFALSSLFSKMFAYKSNTIAIEITALIAEIIDYDNDNHG